LWLSFDKSTFLVAIIDTRYSGFNGSGDTPFQALQGISQAPGPLNIAEIEASVIHARKEEKIVPKRRIKNTSS